MGEGVVRGVCLLSSFLLAAIDSPVLCFAMLGLKSVKPYFTFAS